MIGLIGLTGSANRRCWASSPASPDPDRPGQVLGGNIPTRAFAIRCRASHTCRRDWARIYPTLSIFENVDFFGCLFGQSRGTRMAHTRLFASTD
jgi:ribosome-dependent ATPase